MLAPAQPHPTRPGHPPRPDRQCLRAPELHAAARRMAARVHALQVRIHTFYLKFLQGHT
jgi:hypothetical protein